MFEYKGKQYTLEALQKSATTQGYDNFEEFMQMYKDDGMTEVSKTYKPKVYSTAGQQIDDGFDDDIGIIQSFKNMAYNLGPELQSRFYEFKGAFGNFISDVEGKEDAVYLLMAGQDDAAKKLYNRKKGLLDPRTNEIVTLNQEAHKIDGLDAEENQRYWQLVKLQQGTDSQFGALWDAIGLGTKREDIKTVFTDTGENVEDLYGEALQKTFQKSFEAKSKKLRIHDKNVTGFTDALKKGEVDDMFFIGADFIKSTVLDVGLARLTFGASMAAQMYSSAYTVYNDEKSKRVYGEEDPDRLKKLFDKDEDETAIPAILGGLGYLMERAGYKGIMRQLAKKSFGGRKAVSLLATGGREGLTEYGQALTERMNKNLGQGMSIEDGARDVSNYMWTEEAFDQFFAGLIGGGGIGAAGATVQGALRADETSNKFVNDKINNIAGLLELKTKAKTKKEIKKLDDLIQVQEVELKEYLESNKNLSDYLVEGEVEILTDLVNSRRDKGAEIRNLQKRFKKGLVSEQQYKLDLKELTDSIKLIDSDLKMIKTEANMRLLKNDLDKGGVFVGDIKGLEQVVYETETEFFEALKKEYEAQGKKMPNFKGVKINGLKIGNKFLINAAVAAEQNAVATSTHEVLHGIVKSTLQADDGTGHLSAKGEIIVNSFISQLSGKEKRLIEGLLKDGKYKFNKDGTEKDFKEYGEEYITMYAQLSKEGKFTKSNIKKAGLWFSNLFNKESEFKKISFKDGKSTRAFLDAYVSGDKTALEQAKELARKGVGMKQTTEFSKKDYTPTQATKEINDLGKVIKDEDGNVTNLEEKGLGNVYYEAEADNIVKKIEEKGYLDGLIKSKYKGEIVPKNFVKQVISELSAHIKAYKPERKNESGLFGWINPQIANKATAVYNREYKGDEAIKGAKDIGETTKEGEVKIQIAAEPDARMEAFEEENLSPAVQAKKEKADKQKYSKYRQKLGFETGSKIYNEVLENVKKSLMIAYGTTQNITDVQLRAQAIATKLKKEYANLNSPLFKQLKNFLTYGVADVYVKKGTKDVYISNLKKFREDIVKNISTADLVQMERNTPEADRIFTNFVKVLTSIEQVQDAVNKEQLAPDALNKITKDKKTGKGAFSPSLYEKITPTETELVSWADQPGKNPITGLKQGLKGTRKDGLAMRMVNGLVTDAIMEARQSEQVQERIAGMDIDPGSVAELGAAIGKEVNVKFSKSNAIGDVTAAIDGAGSVNVYSQIKFSKSHREAYEKQLTKRRPDLTEKQRKNAVQSVFDFVDGKEIPNNKKSKYEKMAMHYTANGHLILPEDGYKVIEAERLATQKKLDPFSFKNPNVLIETFVGEVKGARTNPDKVKTFTNKTELTDGVTIYNVEDSKQGQKDVRKVIDTHFGKKSNPWCLCARDTRVDQQYGVFNTKAEAEQFADKYRALGYEIEMSYRKKEMEYDVYADLMTGNEKTELNEAWSQWKRYNEEGNGHKIAFHNGRLVAFRDGNNMSWWDRNDKATDAPVVRGKKDKDGFVPMVAVYKNKSEVLHLEKQTGNKKNGTLIKKDIDGTVALQETRKNGKTDGLRIEVDNKNKKSNDYNRKITQNFKEGQRSNFKEERTYTNTKAVEQAYFGKDEIRVDNITKYERSLTERNWVMQTETITIEGTVNQKYFKEFQDPSSADGFTKTNLPYLTPAHERYYGIQGQKVEIVKTTKYEGKSEDVTVTINGIVQEPSVKFSKSAVKFSLTKLDVDRKLGPYLAKQLKDSTSLEQQAFWSGIQELVQKGVPVVDAYNAVAQKIKNQYGVDIVGVKQLDDNVKNYYLPKIREAAKEFSVDWYKSQLKEVKGDIKAELDIINDYIINVGRPIRSGMVYNITSNEKLMNDVYKQFGNKYKEHYELVKVNNGQKVMFRTKKGGELQNINLYQDVTAIKSNPKQYWGKIDEQSVKARNWLNKLLDSKQSDGIKKAIIQLTSYGQRSPIRKLSKAGVYREGLPTSETTLEHEITVNDIHSAIIDHIDGKIDRAKLNELLNKAYVHVLPNKINDILKAAGKTNNRNGRGYESVTKAMDFLEKLNQAKKLKGNIGLLKFSKSQDFQKVNKAVQFSRSANNSTKGITVLDFDDTLATTKSLVKFTRPDGTVGTLNAEQYASTYESLADQGYKFDFSEFNKVLKGKKAPLFEKALKLQDKFGPDNMFILTARPPAAQKAIFEFLKANGLNIPIKNIAGLGNSTAEAKALWIGEKVGEGYNDFYFADDALQNVKAVKNMLEQLDVKSKVQQAKVKFSKSMNEDFNDILENVTDIESKKRFSAIKARKRGESKGKFRFFIPPSHEDFVGLLYNFIGKGKEGNAHRNFFEKALVRPLNRAYRELNTAKQSIANDYKSLNKQFEDVKKKLTKKTPDGDFTYQDAIRTYLWNKHGHTIPGLSKTDQTQLSELVMRDPQLQAYAETLNVISKQETYVKPTEGWNAGDIRTDLDDATGRVGRADFFTEFNENSEVIFSQENLNKIEAAYGEDVVSAIKDILYRTKTGRNRPTGQNKTTNAFMNYLNGSVAATMFFNIRSSVLQQMSMVNFINFGDNNILAAAKAFANQPQYYKDWAFIFNSDFMKQRRGGIKTDINGAELAASLRGAKNTPRALLAKLLELGFLPTQIGDNVAIATGGSTFYRNRINTYLKQGLTQKEAESKAWTDFQILAEATQQSARPDMVSQQQASPLGKIILAFQNVTSQFNRLGKKAFLDIKNRRITPGNTTQLQSDMSNASRIAYYFAIQNVIFYSLQTALFSAMFDDDEDDERMLAKKERVINGTLDSVLRGSGVWGAVIATLKNMAIAYHKEREKDWNGDEASVLVEALNVSPPLGIKARKIVNAERTLNYNKSVMEEMETFDIENPQWSANTSYVEALTNIPLNRLYNKTLNIRQSLNNQHNALQRVLMFSGWSQWNIGIGDSDKIIEVKKTIKEKKKNQEKKLKSKVKKYKPKVYKPKVYKPKVYSTK